jgi:prefoldin subunit 5
VSALGKETLQGVENFLDLYQSQSERLDKKLREIEAELNQTESELKAVNANTKQLMPKPKDIDLHR